MWARANHSLTTKANVFCQGEWFSLKLLILDLQFSSSLLLHCIHLLTEQDCRDRRKPETDFMFLFERAGNKMLCAVDYIFNLLCAFNCLQPMKKFVFSVASRTTGSSQIKPSGSEDENDQPTAWPVPHACAPG